MQFQSLLILQDFHDDEWKCSSFVLYHAEHEMYYENIYLHQLNLVFRFQDGTGQIKAAKLKSGRQFP